jgi:CubicO group peptidase (beta-lactamase class C family)
MNGVAMRLNEPIGKLFASLVREGKERGLQATAYFRGEMVLDTWAGTQSADGPAVNGDTLFPVYSTGKGIQATVIHLLAERGKLSYDDPIAKHWPAFAANGKDKILVRHALNHTSGLALLPNDLDPATMYDWDAMVKWIEQAKPTTTPGTELVYHAVTFAWILGELAQRADGRKFMEIVRQDVCRPLGITTLYFGIPDEVESRVAVIEEAAPAAPAAPVKAGEMVPVPATIMPLGAWMNDPRTRRTCIPASTGIMNTRAVARHYAALLPGGVDGVELLPPARVKLATQLQRPDDRPDAPWLPKALGYAIGGEGSLFGHRTSAFGHNGHGGSTGFADPEVGFAFAFARNRIIEAETTVRVVNEVRGLLGIG